MTETGIIALTAAISTPAGAIIIKLIDCWLQKRKNSRDSQSSIQVEQHRFLEDTAVFRAELMSDITVLRDRIDCLEEKLEIARRQNSVLEREMYRLNVQNNRLTEELVVVKKLNAELDASNKDFRSRINELEQNAVPK